ncbi:hypothetical protein ACSSS7_003211 [Eimeria intestinalis]
MSKQSTFKFLFKLLSVFTGILFVRQAGAGIVSSADAEATVAAAQAAAAAAEAAAAAAKAAAAAAAEVVAGSRLARAAASESPEASHDEELQLSASEQPTSLPSSQSAFAASTTSARPSERPPRRGRGPRTDVGEGPPSAGDRTSPALPPGSSTALDVSAEDSTTFEPRLYLPPQRPPLEERRRRQWMGEEAQFDVLLQQVMEQTAAQAWNSYRRHRFEALMEPTTTEFLVRRRERQREEADADVAAVAAA